MCIVSYRYHKKKKNLLVIRTLRIYTLNFPVCHTVVLTIVIMLYIITLVLFLSHNWKSIPFNHLASIPTPPSSSGITNWIRFSRSLVVLVWLVVFSSFTISEIL